MLFQAMYPDSKILKIDFVTSSLKKLYLSANFFLHSVNIILSISLNFDYVFPTSSNIKHLYSVCAGKDVMEEL